MEITTKLLTRWVDQIFYLENLLSGTRIVKANDSGKAFASLRSKL